MEYCLAIIRFWGEKFIDKYKTDRIDNNVNTVEVTNTRFIYNRNTL